MTHNELLDYLREHEEYWTSLRAQRWTKVPAFNALRAVVELHRPPETKDGVTRWIANDCAACTHSNTCPTIKAIEKELG